MTQNEAATRYRQLQDARIEAKKDGNYAEASRLGREAWELAKQYGLATV